MPPTECTTSITIDSRRTITTSSNRPFLVLGATGKTGSRVVEALTSHGVTVRRAARRDTDIAFDWDASSTYDPAREGVGAVYIVPPAMRTDHATLVAHILDRAETAGVTHVVFLSAYGVELAPPDVALRAIELDLESRTGFTHSIVRPAWFMENFSGYFLQPAGDTITIPNGSGAEAFVSVVDIAAVAVATLLAPELHAGRAYAPTGPEALAMDDVARTVSVAAGREIRYQDPDREEWINSVVRDGIPVVHGDVLRELTKLIADGNGARPNDDVLTVTGCAPRSFADYAAESSGVWA